MTGKMKQQETVGAEKVDARYTTPVYENRTEPKQIVLDNFHLWAQLISQKKEDRSVFMEYETPVKQVALLTAHKAMELEKEIEQLEIEFCSILEDAKIMGAIRRCVRCTVLTAQELCADCRESE
ncbi:hypothetical protein SAMN04487969_102452 [Paenibacillus algorifonticola]|uniref:Uncharacterized protein n=1 Tax=Paenibacillus algorifonticola TaxID=684063 RepID=A0A1I2AEX2_9BACL|nr:hypothetical protein [Paenibacillus algorifonticola]SFE42422.1 hypothetical protein SAMN04487969_102452 [Paenibacillus algorifonticola]